MNKMEKILAALSELNIAFGKNIDVTVELPKDKLDQVMNECAGFFLLQDDGRYGGLGFKLKEKANG